MKNQIQTLADKINTHDIHACMSDDSSKWDAEQILFNQINSGLKELSLEDLHDLAGMIKHDSRLRYFDLNELEPLPKPQSIRSKVFTAAWYFFNKGIYETFGQSLKAAWKAIKLKAAMLTSVVILKFRKTDGTIRTALATLKLDTEYKPKRSAAKYTPDVIKFFDRTVDGWRSARIERIIAA